MRRPTLGRSLPVRAKIVSAGGFVGEAGSRSHGPHDVAAGERGALLGLTTWLASLRTLFPVSVGASRSGVMIRNDLSAGAILAMT